MRNSDFLTLLQHLPVAIYRFTMTPVWKFEFLNNGIYFISGYPLSYFSGDTPHDYASLIHPDDTEIRLKTITNRMLQGKPYTVEYRILHADGRFAWVNEEGRPFTDESGKSQFIGNIVDITHKKRVIETYRLNESRLSSLLDLNQMTDIPLNEITEYALEQAIQLTRSKIGYCAFVNPGERIIRMYSWSKMAIKNCQIKHKKNTYHIDEMGLWGEAIRQRKPIITNDFLAPHPHKRGQPEGHVKVLRHMNVPVFDQGRIVIIAGVGNKKEPYDQSDVHQLTLMMEGMWNIIRRKEIEEHLRDNELKYRSVFEHAGAPSLIIEEDMTVSMANLKFEQFSGYSRQKIEKKIKFSTLIDREDIKSLKKFLKNCTRESKEAPFEYESTFIDYEGVSKNIIIKLGILPKQERCIASFFDITQSKRAETQLRRENLLLKSNMQKRYGFGRIVGKSAAMQDVYNHIIEAAASDANVIVYGESGTGKELISRAIHDVSDRRGKAFVCVNCGAVPEHLLESEFFGSKKGAFTGAYSDRIGYLAQADGGTLFLDEVGEIGLPMQVKLLRAIEGNGYTPVGGTEVIKPDLRIIAATSRDLLKQVDEGKMRKDFFYRVHIVPIELPPLRNRKEDIPLLAQHFLHEKDLANKKGNLFTNEVMEALKDYDWPGNVRELQNVLHRFITFNKLDFGHRTVKHPEKRMPDQKINSRMAAGDLKKMMGIYEKDIILDALEKTRWNRTKTASVLNINRKTLFKKMKTHGLQ